MTTQEAYLRYVNDFDTYFDNDVAALNRVQIEKYLDGIFKKCDSNSYRDTSSIACARLAAIKCYYRFMLSSGLIKSNPTEHISYPKSRNRTEVTYLTSSEIRHVKRDILTGTGSVLAGKRQQAWKNRDLLILSLACNTGLRLSALTSIDVDDINLLERSVDVIEKGNYKRTVYYGKETTKILKNWLTDRKKLLRGNSCNALFISNQRCRASTLCIYDIVKKYTAGIHKNISPHKLRSTCATNLYEQTGDIYLVASVLGHKNIQTTVRYTHIDYKKRKEAAILLDSVLF